MKPTNKEQEEQATHNAIADKGDELREHYLAEYGTGDIRLGQLMDQMEGARK